MGFDADVDWQRFWVQRWRFSPVIGVGGSFG